MEFYTSLQAAAFVSEEHESCPRKAGAEAAPSSLCPHCEAFKGFQWALEDTRGRDNSVQKKKKSPNGCPSLFCKRFTMIHSGQKKCSESFFDFFVFAQGSFEER